MSQKTRWNETEQGCLKLTFGLHMYTCTHTCRQPSPALQMKKLGHSSHCESVTCHWLALVFGKLGFLFLRVLRILRILLVMLILTCLSDTQMKVKFYTWAFQYEFQQDQGSIQLSGYHGHTIDA